MKHTQLFIDGTSHLSWLQSTTRCCVFFCLFFDVQDKQKETHCLADDAGDAWFSSETWQTLETKKDTREVCECYVCAFRMKEAPVWKA